MEDQSLGAARRSEVDVIMHVIVSALFMTRASNTPELFHFKLMLLSCSGYPGRSERA